MAEVEVPELWFGWSRFNLESTQGFGILATSEAWPAQLTAALKPRLALVPPPGRFDLVAEDVRECVARYVVGGHPVVVCRSPAGADTFRRRHLHAARALTGFAAAPTVQRIVATWERGDLGAHPPADLLPTRSLPPARLRLTAPRVHVPAWDQAFLADALAAVLAGLRLGRPVVLTARSDEDVARALLQISEQLPDPVSAELTFSTHETDPAGAGVTLAGCVLPDRVWTEDPAQVARVAAVLDVSAHRVVRSDSGPEDGARARTLLTAPRPFAPPLATTGVPALAEALERTGLLLTPPARLSLPALADILDSPDGSGWLRVPANALEVASRVDGATTPSAERLAGLVGECLERTDVPVLPELRGSLIGLLQRAPARSSLWQSLPGLLELTGSEVGTARLHAHRAEGAFTRGTTISPDQGRAHAHDVLTALDAIPLDLLEDALGVEAVARALLRESERDPQGLVEVLRLGLTGQVDVDGTIELALAECRERVLDALLATADRGADRRAADAVLRRLARRTSLLPLAGTVLDLRTSRGDGLARDLLALNASDDPGWAEFVEGRRDEVIRAYRLPRALGDMLAVPGPPSLRERFRLRPR